MRAIMRWFLLSAGGVTVANDNRTIVVLSVSATVYDANKHFSVGRVGRSTVWRVHWQCLWWSRSGHPKMMIIILQAYAVVVAIYLNNQHEPLNILLFLEINVLWTRCHRSGKGMGAKTKIKTKKMPANYFKYVQSTSQLHMHIAHCTHWEERFCRALKVFGDGYIIRRCHTVSRKFGDDSTQR